MFQGKALARVFTGVVLVAGASLGYATVIYDQSLNTVDNFGYYSDIDGELSADSFVLSDAATVQAISWYGMYEDTASSTPDLFNVEIFSNLSVGLFGDLSASSLHSYSGDSVTRSDSGIVDANGETIYQYTLNLAVGWELKADTYLLEISNQNDQYSSWIWADSVAGNGEFYYRYDAADPWYLDQSGYDLAFLLDDGVPATTVSEPGSLFLFGIGCALLARLRKRS